MDKDRINKRRRNLERELRELKKSEQAIHKKIMQLRNKCNHDIIFTTPETESGLIGIKNRPLTYCLICGEYLAPRRYLPKEDRDKIADAIRINMANYPAVKEDVNKGLAKLYGMYDNIVSRQPELSEKEIGKKMVEKLNAERENEV